MQLQLHFDHEAISSDQHSRKTSYSHKIQKPNLLPIDFKKENPTMRFKLGLSARKFVLRASVASLNQLHYVDILQQSTALCKASALRKSSLFHISQRQITTVYCNTNITKIELDALKCFQLYLHTSPSVHNWAEIGKVACTLHNFCKGMKIWVKIYTTCQNEAIYCNNFSAMTRGFCQFMLNHY